MDVTRAPGRRPPRRAGRSTRPADDGFTLVELVVALAVVGTIAASTLTLFVSSHTVTDSQANRQIATHLLTVLLDEARQSGGQALRSQGRGERTTTVGAVGYTQRWEATGCAQTTVGGACGTAAPAPRVAVLTRVVATVSWTDRGSAQVVQGATLVNAMPAEPTFTE